MHKAPSVKSQDMFRYHGAYAVEQRRVRINVCIKTSRESCKEPDFRSSANFKGFSRSQRQSRGLIVISWQEEEWV